MHYNKEASLERLYTVLFHSQDIQEKAIDQNTHEQLGVQQEVDYKEALGNILISENIGDGIVLYTYYEGGSMATFSKLLELQSELYCM